MTVPLPGCVHREQVRPHELRSVDTSATQVEPPQLCVPAGQTQLLLMQTIPLAQARLQPPQLLGSVVVSTQVAFCPAPQAVPLGQTQLLPRQACAGEQA